MHVIQFVISEVSPVGATEPLALRYSSYLNYKVCGAREDFFWILRGRSEEHLLFNCVLTLSVKRSSSGQRPRDDTASTGGAEYDDDAAAACLQYL